MEFRKLLLPATIRTPRAEEIPNTPELLERLRQREMALLVPGFSFTDTIDQGLLYQFYSDINVDNPDLWPVLKGLVMLMPEHVSLIFHHIDNEPSYSPYMDKFTMLNKLDCYSQELSLDGFLEFGLIFQDEHILAEIFVKKAKYIQFWGQDETTFRKMMLAADLFEVPGINFIDEYPLVTEALNLHRPDLIPTDKLIEILSGFS